VSLKEWNKNQTFFVEAYKKENEKYLLIAQSNDFHPNIMEEKTKVKRDLSIIIPVYNAELYLSRCIDSILFSSYKNYEILLIDDGSTDTSRIIMNWYQEHYKDYIKCIYKENEGVSKTRNEGIKEATGEYLAFVDNDDLIHPFMYENLMKTAKENNSDIVIGKTLIRKDIKEHSICLNLKENVQYTYEKMMLEKNNHTINNIFFVAVWNKIIKTNIVKEHPFSDSNYYEDTSFTRTIYSYIDNFYFNKDAYYVWDKRFQKTVGTATNNYFNKKNSDPLFYQKKYRDSIFYCIEYGNQNKISLLLYDSIKEVIEYLKKINKLESNNVIKSLYDEKILEASKTYNLLDNPYIKNNNEILQYIKNLIETRKDF
ncbi:MAG: glycosyltransferase, partial [Bacilli bacterium]|nr:glycosyltransferase [Bacilli bacterium]